MTFSRLAIVSFAALSVAIVLAGAAQAVDPLPIVAGVDLQPLKAQVARVVQALELAGAPLTADQKKALDAAMAEMDPAKSLLAIQSVLDPLCLAGVTINPESRVKVA